MPDDPRDSLEGVVEAARMSGLELDRERAAAIQPLLESLLRRLERIADALPRDAAPPPSGWLG